MTPALIDLDIDTWQERAGVVGHGYRFDLLDLACEWVDQEELQASEHGALLENPALIGCAFAISRRLYTALWGFDVHMSDWGVEDLDLALKCWLLGFSILHDPRVRVAHRFQRSFDRYAVADERVITNALRLARKNLTPTAWEAWVAQARSRYEGSGVQPEGLSARAWMEFQSKIASVERERSYLQGRRTRDESWYADRLQLPWPQLAPAGAVAAFDDSEVRRRDKPSQAPSHQPLEIQLPATNSTLAINADGTMRILTRRCGSRASSQIQQTRRSSVGRPNSHSTLRRADMRPCATSTRRPSARHRTVGAHGSACRGRAGVACADRHGRGGWQEDHDALDGRTHRRHEPVVSSAAHRAAA